MRSRVVLVVATLLAAGCATESDEAVTPLDATAIDSVCVSADENWGSEDEADLSDVDLAASYAGGLLSTLFDVGSEPCDTEVAIDIDVDVRCPRYANAPGDGRCCTGANVEGELRVRSSAGDRDVSIGADRSPPTQIVNVCPAAPGAEANDAASAAVLEGLLRAFGEPLVAAILRSDDIPVGTNHFALVEMFGIDSDLSETLGRGALGAMEDGGQTVERAAEVVSFLLGRLETCLDAGGGADCEPRQSVRTAAIENLDLLIDAAPDDTTGRTLRIFSHLGPDAAPALPAVEALLDARSEDQQEAAAGAFCELAPLPQRLERVEELLDSPSTERARRLCQSGLEDRGGDALAAVPALISVLNRFEDDALEASGVQDALESITGEDFGRDADAWRRWWDQNG